MPKKEWDKKRKPYEFSDETKLKALYRDEWACVNCGTKKEDTPEHFLEIHHILEIWFVVKYLPQLAPAVVNSLENSLCLCVSCHNKEHEKRKDKLELMAIAQGLLAIYEQKQEEKQKLVAVMREKKQRRLPLGA